jgi:hypothetical protein
MGIGETISATAWVLVPLSIFAIPLTAVIGKLIVQPIAAAISRLADAERGNTATVTNQRAAELDARLTRIEQQLVRLAEAEARRQLEAGQQTVSAPALGAGSATPLLRP